MPENTAARVPKTTAPEQTRVSPLPETPINNQLNRPTAARQEQRANQPPPPESIHLEEVRTELKTDRTDTVARTPLSLNTNSSEPDGTLAQPTTSSPDEEPAQTFEEMLDTSKGDLVQKIAKWLIKPKLSPETTIKIIEALQIDHILAMHTGAVKWFLKKINRPKEQNGYTLADSSLASMVDFATRQTGASEVVHSFGAVTGAVVIASGIVAGGIPSIIIGAGMVLLHLPLTLAQEYTRARLTITINKAIAAGRPFEIGKYPDVLGLRLPAVTKQTTPQEPVPKEPTPQEPA